MNIRTTIKSLQINSTFSNETFCFAHFIFLVAHSFHHVRSLAHQPPLTMRFLLAAVILSQAMPVSASERNQLRGTSKDLKSHSHNHFMTRRSLGRRSVGAARHLYCTVGILRNERVRQIKATMECNPSSTDPDTRILSCGAGYNCVTSSHHSSLGGVCMPADCERKLRYQTYVSCMPNTSFPMDCDVATLT